MKMWKCAACMMLGILILCCMLPTAVLATESAAVIASGECGADGDNVTWTLYEDGLLEITGTGAMVDYDWSGAPWYDYLSSINSVKICDGITSVGDYAFYYCNGLTNIEIPDSVTSIDVCAFANYSALESVRFQGDAPEIWNQTFFGVTTIAYCPAGNDTWTEDKLVGYGGTITWIAEGELPRPSATISARDTLDMNLYVKKADFPEQPNFIVKLDGKVLDASEYTLGNDTVGNRWSVTVGLYANHMCKEVTVQTVDADGNAPEDAPVGTSGTSKFTANASALQTVTLNYYIKVADLGENSIQVTLDYGAMAQIAFDSTDTDLANRYIER